MDLFPPTMTVHARARRNTALIARAKLDSVLNLKIFVASIQTAIRFRTFTGISGHAIALVVMGFMCAQKIISAKKTVGKLITLASQGVCMMAACRRMTSSANVEKAFATQANTVSVQPAPALVSLLVSTLMDSKTTTAAVVAGHLCARMKLGKCAATVTLQPAAISRGS